MSIREANEQRLQLVRWGKLGEQPVTIRTKSGREGFLADFESHFPLH